MSPQLLLTAKERSELPQNVRELLVSSGFDVALESLTSFETPEQTRYRFEHSACGATSGFASVRTQLKTSMTDSQSLKTIDFSFLSPQELQKFFSMIGATGVTAFMELGLKTCVSSDDLRAIAELSNVRHGLLLSNQEFFASKLS